MGTAFSDIYDLFFLMVDDYRLTESYNDPLLGVEGLLEGWLVLSVAQFDICNQSLAYDDEEKQFTENLTIQNQSILAKMMNILWLKKLVQDVTQMNLHITDREFKIFAEANNLEKKNDFYQVSREELSQMLVEYGLKNNKWNDWFSGNFYTG